MYEIDPGNHGSPYHLHHANEELIIVIRGSALVRTPKGIVELGPGEVLACPAPISAAVDHLAGELEASAREEGRR